MADLFDDFLRYGLFLGAIFQLICIAAVVFVPPKDENKEGGEESDDEGLLDGAQGTPTRHSQHISSRRSKQERKKRR